MIIKKLLIFKNRESRSYKYIYMKNSKIVTILLIICVALVVVLIGIFLLTKGDLKNTEVKPVVDDAQKINELNRELTNKANDTSVKKVRPITEKDHFKGMLDAPVQLIVYSDFECPFCSKFADVLKKIEESYADKVVIAFRHYPLRSHIDAIPAAIASECAAEQGKFWEMHDRLFQDAKTNSLTIEEYKKNAGEIGLNQEAFNKCLDEEKYKDAVIASQTEAKEFGVNGTPASFVNGEPLPGAVPFDDFVDSSGKSREGMKSIIDRHLK